MRSRDSIGDTLPGPGSKELKAFGELHCDKERPTNNCP